MSDVTRREALGMTAAMIGAGVAATACGEAGSSEAPTSEATPETPVAPEGHIIEPARAIPILLDTDVLVLGGGPAGLSAALAAVREGAHTTLVERYGSFGGVITQQTMGSISWYRFKQTVDAGGLMHEYEDRAKAMGASLDLFGEEARGAVSDFMLDTYHEFLEEVGLRDDGIPTYEILETEMFKWVADVMLRDAGVTPLLHCWATDVIMEGSTITGVITESKSGRQVVRARRVIDCTGDADIAFMAGAPYTMKAPGELMECTMQFGMSGVNLEELLVFMWANAQNVGEWSETGSETTDIASPRLTMPYERAMERGEIPREDDVEYTTYVGAYTALGELPDMNSIHLRGIDPTDVRSLTAAEMKGRERAMWAMAALKRYAPGFDSARIRTFAPNIGIRESRKIVGVYDLTEQDVRNQATFDDSIGICPEFIDGYGIMILPTSGRYFQVPFGCMVPQRVENLLVAGRAVAGDQVSHAATRGMCSCVVTGQGAGVAAAQSIKDGVRVRDVDISRVQQALELQQVRIS